MPTQSSVSYTQHSQRVIQNIHLVWLDENNNENYCNIIMNLQQVIHQINTFVNIDECIDFITDRSDEAIFMIISKTYIQQLLPVADDIPQIKSIYIFDQKSTIETTCEHKCSKINGNFTDIGSICEALKQSLNDDDHNAVSISFVNSRDRTSNTNKNILHCTFMYTQILKEILLTIDFTDQHFQDFLTFCRAEFVGNTKDLRTVDKIQNEYYNRKPIWWYTYESFLYSMLNKALRLMDIDIIVKIGFFVCDLHNHIARLHTEQFNGYTSSNSFIVYRGQGLSQDDFNQMKENRNGLLAFNNFLSTSKNREVSLKFIRRIAAKTDLVPVLFVMHIDPSITRTPFANVAEISAIKREEEVLFSMHSVFRIGQMKKFDSVNTIWEVELIFTSDSDPELHALAEKVRQETEGSVGWHRLGQLLIKLEKLEKAEELYLLLLNESKDQNKNMYLFHQLGHIYCDQAKYNEAIKYNEKSLQIMTKILPIDHIDVATSYNNIGNIYLNVGDYIKAFEYYQKSLEIMKRILSVDHHLLAKSYNNIGSLYDRMDKYSNALEYHEKSVEIWKKSCPPDLPSLATSYSNIGSVYDNMGEYSKALEYYQKNLEISKKVFPADHLSLATSYNCIGIIYYQKQDYQKSLEYLERALNILQHSLSSDHPNIQTTKKSIRIVRTKL